MSKSACPQTKPAIQGYDCHYSHTEKKLVLGHFLVWVMVHTKTQTFPFAFRL